MSRVDRKAPAAVIDHRLIECEKVIKKGERAFIEVGLALAEIRDKGLWKSRGYDSFPDYVSGHWGWTKGRASQLISAAQQADGFTVVNLPAPENEGQSRELLRAGDAAPVVWQRVTEQYEKPTAAVIREEVERIAPRPAPRVTVVIEPTGRDRLVAWAAELWEGDTTIAAYDGTTIGQVKAWVREVV